MKPDYLLYLSVTVFLLDTTSVGIAMDKTQRILPVVFFSSMSGLAFEVLLTRIFSISLWYHFAFMIISIAMLGLAAGGTLLSLFPRLRSMRNIGLYAFCLAVAMPAGYLLTNLVPFDPVRLSWEKTELLHLCLYYLALALPFLFGGLIVAAAFSTGSRRSGLIYGADLLGAGLGSLGILFITGMMSPERGIFVLSAIVLAVSFTATGKGIRVACLLLIVANLAIFILQPGFARLRLSPYKELTAALLYPGAETIRTYYTPFARIDTFRSPAVRFAPGLSLAYPDPLPEQIGFSVDGGNLCAITGSGSHAALKFLNWLPAALPYRIVPMRRVLVLDPGGGLEMLLARYNHAGEIIGIETNPWLAEIVRKDFGTFSGNIYGKNVGTGLGRSWLAERSETFDLIDISLQGASPAGSFGIAEDYRYTVEAFREYFQHLAKDGVLCVSLYIIPPPRNELRILATLADAMESSGIRDPARHIAAVRSWGSITILAKKSPLTGKDTEEVRGFARERMFDLVCLPGMTPAESNRYIRMPSNEYFNAFSAILSPRERSNFLERYLFDVGPVHDDAPFLHYFLTIRKIGEVYRVMGRKWQFFLEEGFIIPALLFQAAVLSALLVLLPVFAVGRNRNGEPGGGNDYGNSETGQKTRIDETTSEHRRIPDGARLLPYFALLGLGYMFVEITLIQRLILPLENPPYAMATVLASLLLSSGIGSLFSYRHEVLGGPLAPAATALVIILYGLLLPTATLAIAQYRPPLSFLFAFPALFPVGFLMGIPFPSGIKALGERNPQLIPWAWAINGCCSVIGPLCAIILAMASGFRYVLLAGALAYFLAFLNLFGFVKRRDKAGLNGNEQHKNT